MIQKFNRSPFRTVLFFAVEFGAAFAFIANGMIWLYCLIGLTALLISIGMK